MGVIAGQAEEAEVVLNCFVEGLFRLMLDRHKAQVIEMDLTPVQAQALRLIREGPLATSKLAAALGISAPAVTQLTDRLGRKKLIERQTVETDRRAVMVAVTEEGVRLVDRFHKGRVQVFSEALSRLNDDDRLQVMAALSKITSVLGGPSVKGRTGVTAEVEAYKAERTRRTPDRQPGASNDVGQRPVNLPTKRMRIEWD
jgi:DNA-binding MarR family transcriptional regulator